MLAALPFDDERHAIALANGTPYGLVAGVWTHDLGRAHRVAAGIRAGPDLRQRLRRRRRRRAAVRWHRAGPATAAGRVWKRFSGTPRRRMSGSLCDLVDELADDLVALLQRLIRIPTVNPPGECYEEFVADFKRVLDELGYATEVHYAPTELAPLGQGLPRPNLIGKLEGDGPLVHLNGHYDVVPVGNDWTKDPFGGELVDGKIYGRGAADMKSGLAAQIIAVEALRRAGLKPNVHQSAVPDEETVGVRNAGMGWLVEQGLLRRRRRDHHRAVRPRRRRHRPQGRDLGRDHDLRQAGARLRAAARRQRDRADGRLPESPRRAPAAAAGTARHRLRRHARQPARDAVLRHDPRRPRDEHRPRPLHGHVQPPPGPGRGPRQRAPRAARAAAGRRATSTTSSTAPSRRW